MKILMCYLGQQLSLEECYHESDGGLEDEHVLTPGEELVFVALL